MITFVISPDSDVNECSKVHPFFCRPIYTMIYNCSTWYIKCHSLSLHLISFEFRFLIPCSLTFPCAFSQKITLFLLWTRRRRWIGGSLLRKNSSRCQKSSIARSTFDFLYTSSLEVNTCCASYAEIKFVARALQAVDETQRDLSRSLSPFPLVGDSSDLLLHALQRAQDAGQIKSGG